MIGVLLLIVTFWGSVGAPAEVYAEAPKTYAACVARGEELKALALKDKRVKSASYKCFVADGGEKVST
jgi:hypothetical protein